MKKALIFVSLLFLAACSSAPVKKLYKNCDAAGGGLFYCEEIPAKEVGGKNR